MRVREHRRAWWFAAGSAALHFAIILMMSRVELAPEAQPSTQIELTIVSQPAPQEPERPSEAPAAITEAPRAEPVAPPPVARRERKRGPREPVPSELSEAPSAPSAPAQPQPEVATVETPAPSQPSVTAPAQPSRGLDLSPHRAAASMVDSLELPAAVCNPRGTSSEAAACTPSDRAAFAQRELDESLRQAANEPKYRVKREPPQLHRQGDGSYRYDGHVFTARIRADGRVDFSDSTSGVDGFGSPLGPGVRGHFDPSDALEKAITGKESYTSEKRWFLEQTVELREKLTAAARNQERMDARRTLERALERILAAAELDASRKRERILVLWEDCGDDAEATDIRRIVEAFVRTRMPEGSELGFTRAELERFNRGRSGAGVFDPYRT